MKHPLALALAIALTATAPAYAQSNNATANVPASNPFLTPSNLPFHAPPLRPDQGSGLPAGASRRACSSSWPRSRRSPTIRRRRPSTTRSSRWRDPARLLTRVDEAFFGVTGANTNDALQKIQETEAPKLAAHPDAIYLNAKLFAARQGDLRPARQAEARRRNRCAWSSATTATSSAPARSSPMPTRPSCSALNKEESTLRPQFTQQAARRHQGRRARHRRQGATSPD